MAKDPAVETLDEAGQIEMRIVESGARRDLGETAAAVRTLEGRELRSRTRADWSPRLRYAYAEALLADGQRDAAREWFERAAGVDVNDVTDAADRVAELDAEEARADVRQPCRRSRARPVRHAPQSRRGMRARVGHRCWNDRDAEVRRMTAERAADRECTERRRATR